MQTTNINIRTDKELKENCEKLFEDLGLTMSTAINIFLRQSLRTGGLPFEVKLDTPEAFKSSPSGKNKKKLISESNKVLETEQLKIYDVSVDDIPFRIAITKRVINKRTVVHCSNENVSFEERIPLGIHPVSEHTVICKPKELMTKERRTLLIISGTPDIICGLDEGIIASAKRYTVEPSSKFLYIMSEKAFEGLEL